MIAGELVIAIVAKHSSGTSAADTSLVAKPIVSSGNPWMINAVVRGRATAWVVDAQDADERGAAPARGRVALNRA